jgi:hypothetical protein
MLLCRYQYSSRAKLQELQACSLLVVVVNDLGLGGLHFAFVVFIVS